MRSRTAALCATLVASTVAASAVAADGFDVAADGFVRRLEWRDGSLVTAAFVETVAGGRPRSLAVESDEFGVVLADGTRLTAADYAVAATDVARNPVRIVHRRHAGRAYPAGAPESVEVVYDVRPPAAGAGRMIVKSIGVVLPADEPAPVAVEVERRRATPAEIAVGTLPRCGDAWQPAVLPLDAAARARLAANNVVSIRAADGTDTFKVRRIRVDLPL